MLSFKQYFQESDTSHTFKAENALNDHLINHGLVHPDDKTAGSTGGQDFKLTHPRTKQKFKGTQRETIGGETKLKVGTGKFGSLAIRHTPEKGWHIPESTKKAKPRLSAAAENSEVTGDDGVKRKLLHHLNYHWGASEEGKKLHGVTGNTTDMGPAHAYMQDHDVHVIHIGDRGTFRAGHSHKKDHHGTGLPSLEGTGRFTVNTERKRTPAQEKAGTGMQINFRPHPGSVKHSPIDINTDTGAKKLKANMSRRAGAKKK